MFGISRAGGPLLAFAAAAAFASAQWITYPTPNVPRKAGGSPNLSAPTPRTADGKPDLTGIWDPEKNRPCPKDGCFDQQFIEEFSNIGWSLKGGLPYQPWALKLKNERHAANGKDDPGTSCKPIGIVKDHTAPFFRRMIQIPGLLAILTEHDATFRQIYTDGRPLPEDPQPTPLGYSTGRWEGDTLVVQTNGIPDGQWLDRDGSPLTDAARITERFRRPDYGHLQIELTVNDPKAYTAAWTVTLKQVIVIDEQMLNSFCMEAEKDAGHLVAH